MTKDMDISWLAQDFSSRSVPTDPNGLTESLHFDAGTDLDNIFVSETGSADDESAALGRIEIPTGSEAFKEFLATWKERFQASSGLKLGVGAALLLPLAACGGGSNGGGGGGFSGTVFDGAVNGATVYRLTAGTTVASINSANAGLTANSSGSAATNTNGNFVLGGTGQLVSIGGTDAATGLPVSAILSAPAGSTVVTPLTTLIQSIVGNAPVAGAITAAEANATISFGLGVGVGATLLTSVPTGAALTATVEVGTVLTQVINDVIAQAGGAGALTAVQIAAVNNAAVGFLANQVNTAVVLSPSVMNSTAEINAVLHAASGAISPALQTAVDANTALAPQIAIAESNAVFDSMTGTSGFNATSSLSVVTNFPAIMTAFAAAGDKNPVFTLTSGGQQTITLAQLSAGLTTLGAGSTITFNASANAVAFGTQILIADTAANLTAPVLATIHGTAVEIKVTTGTLTLTPAQLTDALTPFAQYNFATAAGAFIAVNVTSTADLHADTLALGTIGTAGYVNNGVAITGAEIQATMTGSELTQLSTDDTGAAAAVSGSGNLVVTNVNSTSSFAHVASTGTVTADISSAAGTLTAANIDHITVLDVGMGPSAVLTAGTVTIDPSATFGAGSDLSHLTNLQIETGSVVTMTANQASYLESVGVHTSGATDGAGEINPTVGGTGALNITAGTVAGTGVVVAITGTQGNDSIDAGIGGGTITLEHNAALSNSDTVVFSSTNEGGGAFGGVAGTATNGVVVSNFLSSDHIAFTGALFTALGNPTVANIDGTITGGGAAGTGGQVTGTAGGEINLTATNVVLMQNITADIHSLAGVAATIGFVSETAGHSAIFAVTDAGGNTGLYDFTETTNASHLVVAGDLKLLGSVHAPVITNEIILHA